MKIANNYLYLRRQRDFTNKLLLYFYDRLKVFLCRELKGIEPPTILFTSKREKLNEYFSQNTFTVIEEIDCRAFFDDNTGTIVFDADKYNIKSENFRFNKEDIIDVEDYRYIINLADIYHEILHFFSFNCTDYTNTDFIEGTDEIFTYILTGQNNIDYIEESIALWYIGRKLLKMSIIDFYVFIRNSLISDDFNNYYLLSNKKMIKIIGNKYNGNIDTFFNNIKKDFGKKEFESEMMRDLNRLHNLIFYKY